MEALRLLKFFCSFFFALWYTDCLATITCELLNYEDCFMFVICWLHTAHQITQRNKMAGHEPVYITPVAPMMMSMLLL